MPAYAPNDAIAFAKTMVKKMPLDDTTVSYQILDYVAQMVWMAAPWRWTLGALAQVTLVPGASDYALTTPADFAYIESAYLADGKTESPLYVESWLPTVTQTGLVTKVAHIPNPSTTDVLRVHPAPPAACTPALISIYKKLPAKITATNAATPGASGVPDQWAWVYQLGVLWLAYHYADDAARAGLATLNSQGQIQYTGFLGAFQSGLDEMRKSEKLPMTPAGPKERG